MIYGIGTDIVHVPRMKKNLDRYGDNFAKRILAKEEFEAFGQSSRTANFLAKRFAAKEAMSKALGTGFRNGLHLSQIFVTHDDNGKPAIECKGKAKALLLELGIVRSHLSLSDETEFAIAYVVLEI